MKITDKGIIINIKISPNAKKNEIVWQNDEIKVKITAQPIDGKANKCLIEYLSKLLKMPKSSIKILKGDTSKDKTILFETNQQEKINHIKDIFHLNI